MTVHLLLASKDCWIMFFGFKRKDEKAVNSERDVVRIIKRHGAQAHNIIKDLAIDGNIHCQKFFAQINLIALSDRINDLEPDEITSAKSAYEYWATKVAESGDVFEQCNLANYYFREADLESGDNNSLKNLQLSAKWFRAAADNGLQDAIDIVEDIEKMVER